RGYAEAINSVGLGIYHYSMYDNTVNNWLVQKHKEKHRTPPDLFTGEGFLAAQMVARALEENEGKDAADGIIKSLEGMKL
ncbi:hypothetical protein SL617_31035, partial [Klebsiella michiganensis]|uniref:hypothetical protein n=1 Tax=Klebsiella michiganensis TaxID=1134687 RepID=UPI003862CF4A